MQDINDLQSETENRNSKHSERNCDESITKKKGKNGAKIGNTDKLLPGEETVGHELPGPDSNCLVRHFAVTERNY